MRSACLNLLRSLMFIGVFTCAAPSFANEMEDALLAAAKSGNVAEIDRLVQLGQGVECEDETGSSPLSLASQEGHLAAVERLREIGANVDHRDMVGNTPLIWAISNGHFDVAKFLISWEARLDLKSSSGLTAFDAARASTDPLAKDVAELIWKKQQELKTQVASPDKNSRANAVPAPSKPHSFTQVKPLAISAKDIIKYKLDKSLIKSFNDSVSILNSDLKSGRDFRPALSLVNSSAMLILENYPPMEGRIKSIFSLFGGRLFNAATSGTHSFEYYGTSGVLEARVDNRDIYGVNTGGLEGYFETKIRIKSYSLKSISILRQGEFYLIDARGRQCKGLNRLELLTPEIWGWVNENGGMNAFSPPEIIFPGSEAEFKILFPRDKAGVTTRVVYSIGNEFVLTIPIWENIN